MPGTGAGWDSCLYRIFIVGGLAAVVGATLISVALTPDDSYLPLYVGIGSVSVFMVSLVAYWAYQIFFKGYGSPKVVEGEKVAIDDPAVLSSWNTLFTAMTTEGGDPAELKQMEQQGRSSLMLWYGWSALIALGPIVLMVPYLLGWMEWSIIRIGVAAYIGLVIMMIIFTARIAGGAVQASEAIYLAPLGLRITGLPQVGLRVDSDGARHTVKGASVVEGERFGRPVRIELDGWHSVTAIQAKSPEFHVKSRDGKLESVQGAPSVDRALSALRKAKRWAGLEVRGDGQRIVATRRTRGVNMWLYDLWLIERVLREETRS